MEDRTLRSRLIRLAHTRVDLRPHLLPLLGRQASGNEFPVRGIGDELKGWVVDQARRWAVQHNQGAVQEEELISVPGIRIRSVREHGTATEYEMNDGEEFEFKFVMDLKRGTYRIEPK